MKKITLTQIIFPDKTSHYTEQRKYHIFLSSELKFSFSSLRLAKAFLSEVNRTLNYKLYALNNLYCELFLLYRKNWFYLDNDLDLSLTMDIKQINDNIERLVKRRHYANENALIIKAITATCDLIGISFERLGKILESRKDYAACYHVDLMRVQCEKIKNDWDLTSGKNNMIDRKF